MMALGEILRNARVQKGMKTSDVAESTRMMVQVVEGLEQEDFRRIAAPIYGRGFIKLYAELLELDPEPLIRDFMELYDGARVPAVRMKKVEPQPEIVPVAPPVPVTRTVSGPAPLIPQKQTVQPRPAVRVLHAPTDAEKILDEKPVVAEDATLPVMRESALERTETETAVPAQSAEQATSFVVEPEEPYAESDEPDLFHPKPLRHQADDSSSVKDDEVSLRDSRPTRKRKYPIFKIGGRLDEPLDSAVADEASRARSHVRIQAFIAGFSKLKDGVRLGVGRKMPVFLSQKQVLTLGGAGLVLVVLMVAGISVLFKMTGSNVTETPVAIIERVAPPPALYVD